MVVGVVLVIGSETHLGSCKRQWVVWRLLHSRCIHGCVFARLEVYTVKPV